MKTECWFGTEMIKRHMLHLAIKDLSPVMHIRMCGSWKGKFALPEESRKTKGESIEYQPPKNLPRNSYRDYDGDWKRTNSGDEKYTKNRNRNMV
ncbi:hypothetical protein P7H21_25190 [Paenibacillus larvae]|nr:hypothetical protein [Paenibacillus larvae]MDT2306587.1 hypothetical protein [Paenibacillus larvae]